MTGQWGLIVVLNDHEADPFVNFCLSVFLCLCVQVNAPIPIKPGAVEQYKRAFARQRARDLAQHADTLLSKDKEIAALQHECRQLEAKIGQDKVRQVDNSFIQPSSFMEINPFFFMVTKEFKGGFFNSEYKYL